MGKNILREKSILFRGNPGKKYVFQGKTQGNMYLLGEIPGKLKDLFCLNPEQGSYGTWKTWKITHF